MQRFAGDFDIIKMEASGASGLSFFVSFAGDQHNVTGLGLADCQVDGLAAVGLDLIWSFAGVQNRQRLRDDFHGILAARIIRGQNHVVATRAGDRAHQWTLTLVAIAATSEEGDDPAGMLLRGDKFPRDGGEIAKSIIGVGVVHDYGKGLARIYALEASRSALATASSVDDGR